MIFITNIDDKGKKAKKFRWVQIGDNPNVLNHCQPMIDKDSVWVNLFATAKQWHGRETVQDDTGRKRLLYRLDAKGKVAVNEPDEMKPRYYPGKNPKR